MEYSLLFGIAALGLGVGEPETYRQTSPHLHLEVSCLPE